jgi:hypothetical protein
MSNHYVLSLSLYKSKSNKLSNSPKCYQNFVMSLVEINQVFELKKILLEEDYLIFKLRFALCLL